MVETHARIDYPNVMKLGAKPIQRSFTERLHQLDSCVHNKAEAPNLTSKDLAGTCLPVTFCDATPVAESHLGYFDLSLLQLLQAKKHVQESACFLLVHNYLPLVLRSVGLICLCAKCLLWLLTQANRGSG